MIIEAIGFGNDINEAKEDAVNKLGASVDDDIQYEVIATQKKKILGLFGGCQAQVRAYVEKPDPKPKRDKKSAKKQNEKRAEQAEKTPKKVKENKQTEKKETKAVSAEKSQEPSVSDDYKNAVDASLISAQSPAGMAVAYLKSILAHLGCGDVEIKVAVKENGAFIVLEGEGLGVIIGHRGETLDALQYLTSLAANSGSGYFKVSLNIGNYREKREQTLVSLANRVSSQVLRTGRSRSLEPMNPYERRIIHTAVQDIEGVLSNSVGEGSRRRVVIYPVGGDNRPLRRDSGRSSRGGNRRGGSRPSSTVSAAPTREPKKDSDMPLYGKIN